MGRGGNGQGEQFRLEFTATKGCVTLGKSLSLFVPQSPPDKGWAWDPIPVSDIRILRATLPMGISLPKVRWLDWEREPYLSTLSLSALIELVQLCPPLK